MRYITLAIAFLFCTAAQAQIIRAEPFYTAPEAVSGNLLLDDYPGAAVAYSLRKLDKDYTGSAIRVRRSSDNTEQDIGFVNNYLDTAGMKTFVGTAATDTGRVVTWYNQADSSGVFGIKNLQQTTAQNQPFIIINGVIQRGIDAYIGIRGLGSQYMEVANSTATFKFLHDGTINDFFGSFQFGTVANPDVPYGIYGTNAGSTTLSRVGDGMLYDDRFSLSRNNAIAKLIARGVEGTFVINNVNNNAATANDMVLLNSHAEPSNATAANRHSLYINGGTALKTNTQTGAVSTANASHNFQLMALGNNSTPLVGYAFEVIFYNSDQSANRTAIRDNINSFYSIY